MRFNYKARKPTGVIVEESIEANDKYALYKTLKTLGYEVITVEEVSKIDFKNIKLPSLSRVSAVEKINFSRNLGSMIEAGLSVSRALGVIERQSKNIYFKKIVTTIVNDVAGGKALHESLAGFPKVFSPLLISMVKAGESSGNLAESLKLVGEQMERIHSLNKKVMGALMYPGIILGVMVVIAILMLTYIVPTLTATFIELKVELPWSTQLIVTVSDLLREHGLLVLLAVLIIGACITMARRRPAGKKIIDLIVLNVPLISPLVKEVNAARTTRTLSSLLNAGVDLVEAIKITEEVVQNSFYKKVLEKTALVVEKGEPMSAIFTENEKLYPLFVSEMMSVGEETGKTSAMLENVAKYYENDVEQRTKNLSTVIEPILMVFIGSAVGFFALSMLSPTYSLMNNI
jgi:type IV pilus assembly protein PilC